MKYCKSKWLAIMLVAFLTGCSIQPSLQTTQDKETLWSKHQMALQQLNAFQASGSLAYFSDSTKRYGRFFLDYQAENNYQLRFTSPTGGSLFLLDVTPTFSTFTDNSGKVFRDYNAEQLVYRLTHMNLPINSLVNWFKGLSDNPDADAINEQGYLVKTTLLQEDTPWQVTWSKYTIIKNTALPSVIELQNNTDRLRLTITKWTIK